MALQRWFLHASASGLPCDHRSGRNSGAPPSSWSSLIGGLGAISISDGLSQAVDSYGIRINYLGGPPLPESEFAPLGFTLNLVDSTGSALLNNSLTSVPPILSAFQERTATFNFYRFDPLTGNTALASAVGQVTGVAVVPLPGAAVLFGSCLLSLAGYCGVRFRKGTMGARSSVES